MYGKIFTSIYDGTLAEDWRALVTFQQFIVLCDSDGVVDMTPSVISRRTNIPIEIIEAGIEFLEQPDKYSRTPDEDGVRIKRLDGHRNWAWKIINHEKYLKLTSYEKIKEQNRERQKRFRDKNSNVTNVTVTDANAKSRHIDIDVNEDVNKDKDIKPLVPQAGPQAEEIKEIFNYWKTLLQHPRSNLDDKRKALIRSRLKSGYSAEDLKAAIVGCSNTPHNMGDNDRGQKYDSIELILRDSGQIDRFMGNSTTPPTTRSNKGLNSNIAAAKVFMGETDER